MRHLFAGFVAALALCLATPAMPANVTVTWTPAMVDTEGNPLNADSWTFVSQHDSPCPLGPSMPDGAMIQGRGKWNGGLEYFAKFVQPAGTTWCYSARTFVWDTTLYSRVSAPVNIEHTTCCPGGGCHN